MMVLRGRGVQKDVAVAALWLEKAARKGNAVAQNQLARLYTFGIGVEPNDVQALKWHELAKKGGVFDPIIDMALSRIPDEQRRSALAAADAFEPEHRGLRSIRERLLPRSTPSTSVTP